jgi:hypothetical protein
VTVAVATDAGAYILSSDEERKKWNKEGPYLKGESVNYVAHSPDGLLFAATLTEGVFRSEDGGRSWRQSSRGLHVRKVWTIEVDPFNSDNVYAGTHYGHLFRSSDSGLTWEEVTGLHSAPLRKKWGVDWAFGTTGLTIHTVKADPLKKGRLFIISSGAGTYRSDDFGKTWKLLRKGLLDSCPVGAGPGAPSKPDSEDSKLKEHLRTVHTCSHKLTLSRKKEGVLYQQNHCGVYSSAASGDQWRDVSPSNEMRHGFPVSLVEGKREQLFTAPAYQGICKKHNSCVQGELAILRSEDGGRSWRKLTKGLPGRVHTCVLRDAMSNDSMPQAGVYFGTTTGQLFGSVDGGESWRLLLDGVGRIQGVSSFFS